MSPTLAGGRGRVMAVTKAWTGYKAQRLEPIFRLAQDLGWPRLRFDGGDDIPPGEQAWRAYFAGKVYLHWFDEVLAALAERLLEEHYEDWDVDRIVNAIATAEAAS
jgi:hypothetical protein